MKAPALLVLLFVLAPPAALARIWIVAADGTGDFTRIQDAIDAAAPQGDEIDVRPATYREALNTLGKSLDLIGLGGPGAVVVDADSLGSALSIPFTPPPRLHVRSLTFTDGIGTRVNGAERDGGGVAVSEAAPIFEDCRMTGNLANYGGGVYVDGGRAEFHRCRIDGNAAGDGGGVYLNLDNGTLFDDCDIVHDQAVYGGGIEGFRPLFTLDHCRVSDDSALQAGGIHLLEEGSAAVTIRFCVIARDTAAIGGAALLADQAAVSIDQTTIADGFAGPGGTDVQLNGGRCRLSNTVIASRFGGGPIACQGAQPSLSCIVVWAPGGMNAGCGGPAQVLLADPRFCDPANGAYTLRLDSPCLPGQGLPGCGLVGALGPGCEAVPTRPVTWGSLKALFR